MRIPEGIIVYAKGGKPYRPGSDCPDKIISDQWKTKIDKASDKEKINQKKNKERLKELEEKKELTDKKIQEGNKPLDKK